MTTTTQTVQSRPESASSGSARPVVDLRVGAVRAVLWLPVRLQSALVGVVVAGGGSVVAWWFQR